MHKRKRRPRLVRAKGRANRFDEIPAPIKGQILYRGVRIPNAYALGRLLELRYDKERKRVVYVCVGIISGKKTLDRVVELLNQ